MTFNRKIVRDREVTAEILGVDDVMQEKQSLVRPNWLGHSKTNADVDAALLLGATDTQLRGIRPTWREHKRHLLQEHGLFVVNHGGVYHFAPIDESEALEVEPVLAVDTKYPDRGDDLLQPSPSPPQTRDNAVQVANHQHYHGFVVLPDQHGNPASDLILDDVSQGLALLDEAGERAIFVITGSEKAAIVAAVTAVKHVWNHWVNGPPAAGPIHDPLATSALVRGHGDWADWQPTQGAFYLYEYRTQDAGTFYVGKGKNGRYLQHVKDVARRIKDGTTAESLSPKQRAIFSEISARGKDQLVRIVAEFQGPHAELCAFVVERFLISTVYGPFSLTNDNLGFAHFDTGKSTVHWQCQPKPVGYTSDYVPLWLEAVRRLVETGRSWQTTEVNLTWMLVRPYEQAIRAQFAAFKKGEIERLEFTGAGNNGSEVSFDWNIKDLPVRIQLVFSRHNTTVHFNLRPRAPNWRASPTEAAQKAYIAFINDRFGLAPEGRAPIKMMGSRDCFFKPFAVGRVDASFDYTDPTSRVSVQLLHAGGHTHELNFQEAVGHLLRAMQSGYD